jgi:hypothetical protein
MLNLLIGFLVGAVVMDLLWAWKTGVFEMMRINYKVGRARRINAKREPAKEYTLDDLL